MTAETRTSATARTATQSASGVPDGHAGAALPAGLQRAFRELAAGLEGLDHEAYAAAGRDSLDPVIGLGPARAPIAFFGRDPGREEIRHGVPFIGAGGRQVRGLLHRRRHGDELAGVEAAIAAGAGYFWANTVPYKPLGNKAWSMAVKRRFQPLMARLLIEAWQGCEVITLGREAFLWFGLGQPVATRDRLEAHWATGDRFHTSLELDYGLEGGPSRRLRLHPLPHPSPLNATWYRRFPGLLAERLDVLEGAGSDGTGAEP